MKIQEVVTTVNQMCADGIINDYAIGGAVGATFYLEPVSTLDVDIFVAFTLPPGQILIDLKPILNYLTGRGCTIKDEYVMIAGWPVQFLPPPTPLVEEALEKAIEINVAGTPTRVFTAEHLAAVALQTGRSKDKARLLHFIEAGILNPTDFQDIVNRHHLNGAWTKFEQQFLKE